MVVRSPSSNNHLVWPRKVTKLHSYHKKGVYLKKFRFAINAGPNLRTVGIINAS